MFNPREIPSHPVVTVPIGSGAAAIDGLVATFHGVRRVPVIGARLQNLLDDLAHQNEDILVSGLEPLWQALTAVAVQVVDRVVAELDLTALVRDRVDIDAVVREVDIDAIIARIDMVTLAETIIDGVDLPRIIRDSTTSVTAEVMTDVRSQGERADDAVSGLVDRVFGRAPRGAR